MKQPSSTPTNSSNSYANGLNGTSEFISEVLGNDTVDLKQQALLGISWVFDNFDYDIHTFQFVGKDKTGKSSSPVRTFSKSQQDLAFKTCLDFNQKGFNVYFMVNEGDGIIHEGKKIPRSYDSVKEISKCFIDTDNCPYSKVQEYLHWLNLTPQFVIQTSKNKYHLHFFIEPVEKTSQNILKWNAVQAMLHRLGDASIKNPSKTLGTDATMSDYSKILRVPGFFHIAAKTEVLIHEASDIPPYTLDELFELTKAQEYLDYNQEQYQSNTPPNVPSLTDTELISKGERFQALQSLALHLANSSAPYLDKLGTFTLFTRYRLENTDEVYLDSIQNLTDKSLDLFNSAIQKVDKENTQAQLSDIQTPESTDTPSPWHLPDSFYLNAPNGFGDVVKQVMDLSLYPCAALSFGVFLTGLSILKAKTHLTPKGSSPAIYTLNVAPSGFGKNDPMTLLQNLFVHNNMRNLISNEIRSDRGIYAQLESGNGFALFILDEVAPLLRVIQSTQAQTHHRNISKALLQLYSAGSLKGLSLGKLASSNSKKGEQEIVIDNPMLALCGFTVPSEFNKLFSSESVTTGLLQRFIPIVADIRHTEENPNADKTAIISSPLFSPYAQDATEFDENNEPVPSLQAGFSGRVKMQYTPEALERFNEISQHYRHKLIETAKDEEQSHISGLYSRLAEQIERVATTLSNEEIGLETLNWATVFIESRHKAVMSMVEGGLLDNGEAGSKGLIQEERVLKAIARECVENKTSIVSRRSVQQRVRKSFGSSKEFDQCISDLVNFGKIEAIKAYKDPKNPTSKTIAALKLQSVID